MTRFPLLLAVLASLCLSGCVLMDALRAPVNTAHAEASVQHWETSIAGLRTFITEQQQNLTTLRDYIAAQDVRLAEARAAAEASKSEAALAVVTHLEGMKATAQTLLAQVQGRLSDGEKLLPKAEDMLASAKTSLAGLKQQGETVPLWVMIGTMILPFVPKLASLIPVVGPIIAPIAGQVSESVWTAIATKRQKAIEADIEAKAKALPYQVDVTHGIISALDDKVLNDSGVDELIRLQKARQIKDGVHATLQPLIAAREFEAEFTPIPPKA